MSGCTPGPWSVRASFSGSDALHITSATDENIAAVRKEADARLIAAAPCLLGAGQRVTAAFRALSDTNCVVPMLECRRECELAMFALDRAIAKAVQS